MKRCCQWFHSVTLGLRAKLIIGATGARIWTGNGGSKGFGICGSSIWGSGIWGAIILMVAELDERISILSKHGLYLKGVRGNVELCFNLATDLEKMEFMFPTQPKRPMPH